MQIQRSDGRPLGYGGRSARWRPGGWLRAALGAFLSALLLIWSMGTALAVEAATVRIGVLAFRSLEQTEARWQETARALEAAVPGWRFRIVAMHNEALDAAVAAGSVDFVLTQPEHYIILRNQHGLTALATLMPLAGGKPVVQLGGVIFGRAQDGLRDLHDVAGKRVAAIYPNSLGGFRIQQWELLKAGVNLPTDVARLEFLGQPQDNVVEAVLQGRADVGFVRTGVLEAMAAEGRLNLEQVQVINPQSPRVFPQLLSTQLYPEWPFLVRRGVPEELSKAVTLALLNISPDSAAARSGEYYGFSPPGDYTPLEAVLLRLRAHPGRLEHFGLADIVDKYALPLVVGLSLLLCAALAGAWLLFQDRRRINAALHRLEQAEAAQRIAAVAFETQEGIVITDASNRILRVNQAFTQVTGYSAAEAEGQTPALLKSGRHDALFYQHMWSDLQNYGRWQGEIWNRRKNGEIYPEWLTVTAVRDPAGQICHYVAIFTDVTERKAVEAQLEYMTLYDSLTGLANRRLFRDRLQQALYTCIRSRQYGGLLFVDLDDFRYINDTLGHSRGDDVLVEVARRLVEVVGEAATVARLGGDDFTVLAGSLGTDLAEAAARLEQLGEALLQVLSASYRLAGGEYHCPASIGVTLFMDQRESAEELIKHAELAMYQAKEGGRDGICFYDPGIQVEVSHRLELERDLRLALQRGEFFLCYQPQVGADGKILGAEALLRWQPESRGLVSPSLFIPVAERTGLILAIGHWVLESACQQLVLWQQQEATRHWTLAVNISARQFHQAGFVDQVREALLRTGADARYLKLELTESQLLLDVEDTIAKMAALRRLGLSLSLDDFGTGYSSLAYLKRLPLGQLKIDQSFVRDIGKSDSDDAIVQAIIGLAGSLSLEVIAEGVETEQQRDLLHQWGCRHFQGFYFHRPMPARHMDNLAGVAS